MRELVEAPEFSDMLDDLLDAIGKGFSVAEPIWHAAAHWPLRPRRNRMIIANHYSGCIVNNSYIHLGVWTGGVLRGALQFGYALNPVAGAQKFVAGTQVDQYLELNRMWLDDVAPRNSESRALSYAFKFIKRACPRVAWVQSFADERCGG